MVHPMSLATPLEAPSGGPVARRSMLMGVTLLVLLAILGALAVISLGIGSKDIAPATTISALFAYDGSTDHRIIWELRMTRTLLGLAVGAALGVGGAVMQAITRNPLADPGILGVNAGASFGVVIAIWLFGISSFSGYVWFAFLGAAVVAVVVYALGASGRSGVTPVRLALAGAAISALLYALVRLIILIDLGTMDRFRFWGVGSLAGADANVLGQLWPFLLAGLVLALSAGTALNATALGDDTARALGTRIEWTRAVSVLAVTLLCGASVAAVGPVGFVGLVIPHVARAWCGPDQRWIMAYCAVLGPLFLMTCDILGRVILRHAEVQVGIVTAALGGVFFVYLVRRIRMVQL